MIMMMIMNNEKMNQFKWLKYSIVVQSQNFLICFLFQIAFYLFYCWNIIQKLPPQFQQWQQWYDNHLIKSEITTCELLYETHVNWIN